MRHQQVKESIIERFINKFTKKGFYIEVGDEFVYPSSI